MLKKIACLAAAAFVLSSQAVAAEFDEEIKICSALAGITGSALQEMSARRIPLEKTKIYLDVGKDPNIASTLRNAAAAMRQGESIERITDALAQGCLAALTGSTQPAATQLRRKPR